MKLAYIPTAYRTPFFLAVAERLEAAGHPGCWLSPNRRWARWLHRHGVPAERILDVTTSGEEWRGREATAGDRAELRDLERAGDLAMHNLVQMDPLLRRRSTGQALRYLAVIRRRLADSLAAQGVEVVFGEQTWAFELLTGQICRAAGIPHLVPHTIRIPDPRFAFFDGYRETDLVAIDPVGDEHRSEARAALGDFRQRRPQPVYMAVDRSVLQARASRLRLLTRHVVDLAGDPYDETSRRPLGLILDHSKQWLRGRRLRDWRGFERPSPDASRPFVLFPLHRQPEASIDIKGSPFANQIEVVRALSRTLPVSHELWVKEHPVALPTRPRGFHQELARLPGVRVLHHAMPIFPLLQSAALVVSITGTAAYEAALMGRPSATIAPIFFERVVAYPRFDPFHDSLAAAVDHDGLDHQPPAAEPAMPPEDFLAWLLARSFPGVVGDALWQPASMEAANLDRVAAGFETLLDRLPRRVAH